MRPFLEKLPPSPGSSIACLNRRLPDGIPFQWHHHPEWELTLTLNSRGQRFIGDHVGEYEHGDLVLVGPNLPHTWVSRDAVQPIDPHVALVIWFHPDWARKVGEDFAEFRAVSGFLNASRRGLRFSDGARAAVADQIAEFFDQDPPQRLLTLLRVLERLSRDTGAAALAARAADGECVDTNRDRIDRVLTHIHTHYQQSLDLAELAAVASLSQSGLHRLFLRHMEMPVTDYVRRLRVGDACARLSGSDQPVSFIANAVGYGALANFNRQFRRETGMTPRDYRAANRRG